MLDADVNITSTYFLMKWALTWPKLIAVDGTASANGPLSKCLDNMEETSPCAQLSLKRVS